MGVDREQKDRAGLGWAEASGRTGEAFRAVTLALGPTLSGGSILQEVL